MAAGGAHCAAALGEPVVEPTDVALAREVGFPLPPASSELSAEIGAEVRAPPPPRAVARARGESVALAPVRMACVAPSTHGMHGAGTARALESLHRTAELSRARCIVPSPGSHCFLPTALLPPPPSQLGPLARLLEARVPQDADPGEVMRELQELRALKAIEEQRRDEVRGTGGEPSSELSAPHRATFHHAPPRPTTCCTAPHHAPPRAAPRRTAPHHVLHRAPPRLDQVNAELMELQQALHLALREEALLRERRGGLEPKPEPAVAKGVALLDGATYGSLLPEEQLEVRAARKWQCHSPNRIVSGPIWPSAC